jgi:hypothetical protein
MDLSKIICDCQKFNIFEERHNAEEYFEVVFFTKDYDAWIDVLSTHLGEPEKPAGVAPTKEHLGLTEIYGGIRSDQTLFCKNDDSCQVLAMLWPWSDTEHITLRMVKI